MEGGTLHDWLELHRDQGVEWSTKGRNIVSDIAAGLAFLHEKRICHRDLKSTNVLMNADGSAALGDFGLSKSIDTLSLQVATQHTVGTLHWMSPEMISHGKYTFSSDVYAVGIMIWEIMSCKLPFSEFTIRHQLENAVVRGHRPTLDVNWSEEARTLMTECWSGDPDLRPSASNIFARLSTSAQPFVALSVIKKSSQIESPVAVNLNPNSQYVKEFDHVNGLMAKARGDLKGALFAFRQAATLGSSKSTFALGLAFQYGGLGEGRDVEMAKRWFALGVEQGNGACMAHLALLHRERTLVSEPNLKLAEEMASQAAKSGDSYAVGVCFYYGLCGSVDKSFSFLEQAAANPENDFAQLQLGLALLHGKGIEKNEPAAVDLFERASTTGNILGKTNLGICFLEGRGTIRNHSKAFKYFSDAASQGGYEAKFNLGLCYLQGWGCIVSVEKAIELWKEVAVQGHVKANLHLGICYMNGFKIGKDDLEAVKCFKIAASHDDSEALRYMGEFYEKGGGGLEKDLVKALDCFRKVADLEGENPKLDRKIEELERKLRRDSTRSSSSSIATGEKKASSSSLIGKLTSTLRRGSKDEKLDQPTSQNDK